MDKTVFQWNELKINADIKEFMDGFGYFHDACLKELHFWSDYFVDGDSLAMAIPEEPLDCKVRILFQRQWKNPSAIELLFEQVVQMNITPSQPNYASIIFDSTFILKDGQFYWADFGGRSPNDNDTDKDKATWICAKSVKWRDASNWMGADLRYGEKGE